MQAELAKITTSDGIALDGAFFAPTGSESPRGAIDAFLLVHGSGGNFYSDMMLAMAEQFRAAGYASASFNTTGHDLVWGAPGRFYGNANEILDRCRIDMDAAITWLSERGYQRIGILGHSMGAVKVVYYQAHLQDARVAAVVSSSPVRLSHSYFLASEAAEEYRGYYEQARGLVESGQPDVLFPVNFPMPHMFSAAAYIDKHGPDGWYNLVDYAGKVRCPLLIAAGTLEIHPRLKDCARDVYDSLRHNPTAELFIQEGADHSWTGMRDKLADTVLRWVEGL